MKHMKKIKVLFVCMGNICRSPTAHGVFEALIEREGLTDHIEVDSAGTHSYHINKAPDPRSQKTALSRGLDISHQRARQAESNDFTQYDYVLAMDQDNYHALCAICPEGMENKLELLMDYAPDSRMREVPDPYSGGPQGFEKVFDMVEAAAEGLLEDIRTRHLNL